MGSQPPDISANALLANLEADVAAKLQAIAGIRVALGLPPWSGAGPLSGPVESSREGSAPGSVRPDEFFRMSVPDAIQRYLEIAKQPQSPKTIASALRAGGLLTTAKNFYANVTTALVRMEGTILTNTPAGWALAEWYTGRAKPGEPPKKRGKKKTSARKKGAKKAAATAKPDQPGEAQKGGYHAFLGAQMKGGKTMAQAAKAWKLEKERRASEGPK
jgi:hypothetical protein